MAVLDPASVDALVEVVAAETGRIGALLAGELPHDLVEHAEETGAELLPTGQDVETSCTCDAWLDPCPHALAVLLQAGWLVEADPFVLFALRGLPRDDLVARLHAHRPTARGRRGRGRRRRRRRRRGGAGGPGAGAARGRRVEGRAPALISAFTTRGGVALLTLPQ